MICIESPRRRADEVSAPVALAPRSDRPLWFVEHTRGGAEWRRCRAGARLDLTTADLLLDHVFTEIARGEVTAGLVCLMNGLEHLRGGLTSGDWLRFSRRQWVHHPISVQVRQPSIRRRLMQLATASRGFAVLLGLMGPPAPREFGPGSAASLRRSAH